MVEEKMVPGEFIEQLASNEWMKKILAQSFYENIVY